MLHSEKKLTILNNSEIFQDPVAPLVPIGIIAVLGLLIAAIPPGNIPSSSPQPGTQGGGGLPSTPSPTLAQSLALVPLGLTAVSVFPPFATPRTVPAVGVIFREQSGQN